MNDEDWLALIVLVDGELRSVGAQELTDEQLYGTLDREHGRFRLHSPKKRLLLMLEAFDRFMMVRDAQTYREALGIINDRLTDGQVESALVLPPEGETLRHQISLGATPELGVLRARLTALRAALTDSPDGELQS